MSTDLHTQYVTSADGTRIAYTRRGNGPAVVLVDGALCYRRAGITPLLLDPLSEHFTVYAYDRRGRDESGDTAPYSLDREIEDLRAVAAATGETPYVCGFSSGAALAMHALADGLPVRGAALYEAPYTVVDDGDRVPPADCLTVLERMVAQNRRGDAVRYFMATMIGMPGVVVTMMKLFMRTMWRNTTAVAHTLPYDIGLMNRTRFRPPAEVSARIGVPTTVLYGERTAPALRRATVALAGQIPGARLVVVPKAKHYVKPDVLVPALLDIFVEDKHYA